MGYSLREMSDAYADLIEALKKAHPDFHMLHTGGGCFVLHAELGNGFNLALSAADGPLVYPDEARGPMELLLFHEEQWGDAWPTVFREETTAQFDPEHRELIAIAQGAAAAAKITAEILRAEHQAELDKLSD